LLQFCFIINSQEKSSSITIKLLLLLPSSIHKPRDSQSSHFQYCHYCFPVLSSPSMALPPIFISTPCKMQFSQMTLKYCIVISEICFCSVAVQSRAARTLISNWLMFKQGSKQSKKKRSSKNSFNAFNLNSFFVYIPFIISLSGLRSLHSY
jgi:hypothetical protein